MRAKKSMVQVVLRVPREWLPLIDKLSLKQAVPGVRRTRSEGLRMALALGLGVKQ